MRALPEGALGVGGGRPGSRGEGRAQPPEREPQRGTASQTGGRAPAQREGPAEGGTRPTASAKETDPAPTGRGGPPARARDRQRRTANAPPKGRAPQQQREKGGEAHGRQRANPRPGEPAGDARSGEAAGTTPDRPGGKPETEPTLRTARGPRRGPAEGQRTRTGREARRGRGTMIYKVGTRKARPPKRSGLTIAARRGILSVSPNKIPGAAILL